jgi:plastocyanin
MKKLIAAGAVAAIAAGALAVPSSGAGTRSVSVKDNIFSPKSVTVSKGTTVRWVWKGKAFHNVRAYKGPARFNSGVKKKGSYSRKLTKRGTYRLICDIHSAAMKMTVKVS